MGMVIGDPYSVRPPSSRTVEDALRPHRKALAALLRSPALSQGVVSAAVEQLTEVAVEVLDVERASVWRFDASRTRIECLDLYERSTRRHSRGQIIERARAPRYFDALDDERSIVAVNAELDAHTREFAEGYLKPNGIGAMLDAPIFAGPTSIGVVCHEHVGPPRAWSLWEELVANTLADFVALVLATAERIASERELDDYRKHLERLVEERTAELRETEAGLSKLFEASPVPMVLVRAVDGQVLLVNGRAQTILGLDRAGRPLAELWVHAEDGERLFEEVTREQHIDDFVTELVGRAGRFYAELAIERVTYAGEDCVLFGIHDVTRQREAEFKLRELATRDGLTGVYNRRRFFELGEQELARADRYDKVVSLAMLDVDRFKSINDRHGHATGDLVLRRLAEQLQHGVRKVDVVARVGGEEFAVLLPETDRDAAELVLQRLAEAIRSEPYDSPTGPQNFSVSVGVIERKRGETLEQALERADRAMYSAKESGRDRVVAL